MTPVSASEGGPGPRYAPADPSLPKPWRALIDSNTNYVYFWNPKTNVTQYERPDPHPLSALQTETMSCDSTQQLQRETKEEATNQQIPQTMEPSMQSQPEHSAHEERITKDEDDLDQNNAPSSPKTTTSLQQENVPKVKDNKDAISEPSLSSASYKTMPSSVQSQEPFEESVMKEEQIDQKNNQTSSSNSKGPRYAPDDPTLPKPWRALIDGNTGYMYFWNPKTKVTQYERPVVEPLSAAAQLQQPSNEWAHKEEDKNQYDRVYRYQSPDDGQGCSIELRQECPIQGNSVGKLQPPTEVALSAEAYRHQHEITIIGNDAPAPYMTFESTGFPPEILREVHRVGFSAPTPIQAQSWPIALKGRDIVAIAKTGSGKTLGYLIPGFILLKRLHNDSKMGPSLLVLSPTRELATQIQDEAVKFGGPSRISCTCLYGGAPKGPQLKELNRGADIVVATPGRLNDILEMNRLSLQQVSYLVLDEADRMLDMGFEPQLQKIVKQLPTRRQTLMFTATWPKEVRRIASQFLDKPIQVNMGNVNELVANKSITQHVEVITPMEKRRRLEQILRSQEPGSKVIIFCSTKRMCDQLARNLQRQCGAAVIHGDKSQSERDLVLSEFRSGKSPILVATDVAARGLDVKDVRVVINYDFPTGVEDYVHRIGRTGRAGATGEAYTFFCEQDSKYASDLVKILKGASQKIPLELQNMVSCGGYGGKSRRWSSGFGTSDRSCLYDGGTFTGSLSQSSDKSSTGHGYNGSFHGSQTAPKSCSTDPVSKHDGWENSRGRNLSRNWDYEQRRSRSRS